MFWSLVIVSASINRILAFWVLWLSAVIVPSFLSSKTWLNWVNRPEATLEACTTIIPFFTAVSTACKTSLLIEPIANTCDDQAFSFIINKCIYCNSRSIYIHIYNLNFWQAVKFADIKMGVYIFFLHRLVKSILPFHHILDRLALYQQGYINITCGMYKLIVDNNKDFTCCLDSFLVNNDLLS